MNLITLIVLVEWIHTRVQTHSTFVQKNKSVKNLIIGFSLFLLINICGCGSNPSIDYISLEARKQIGQASGQRIAHSVELDQLKWTYYLPNQWTADRVNHSLLLSAHPPKNQIWILHR